MGTRFVLQPNGLLARFSDIIDDFTHFDLARGDAIKLSIATMPLGEAIAKVERALADEIPPEFVVTSEAPVGTRRMAEALSCVEARYGRAKRDTYTRLLGVKL